MPLQNLSDEISPLFDDNDFGAILSSIPHDQRDILPDEWRSLTPIPRPIFDLELEPPLRPHSTPIPSSFSAPIVLPSEQALDAFQNHRYNEFIIKQGTKSLFKCPGVNCSKAYHSAQGLRYHFTRGVCRVGGVKNICCTVEGCSKRFNTRGGLRHHLKSHS